MTTTTAIDSTSASAAAASTAEKVAASKVDAKQASLDYDAFLKLLVAQMKNQDPLNPTDATQQLSQLASFSNVEQSIKVNQKLESMLTLSSLTQADAVIGRTITTADKTASGVVTSVDVTDTGAIANLDNGKRVLLGAGIKVQ